jgi:hypothetical protein
MKMNKLCLALSLGLLGFSATAAFADTQSSNDFNIAYEGITTNFDQHDSSMAQKIIFTQNVFKNSGYTYFYKINFEWKPGKQYSIEPDLGVKKSFTKYFNPSVEVGMVHPFDSEGHANSGNIFVYKLGNTFKIYKSFSGKIELDSIGIKHDGVRQDAFKIGPSYKLNDRTTISADYKQQIYGPKNNALEVKIGYDF